MENSIIFTEQQLKNYTARLGWSFISAVLQHYNLSPNEEETAQIVKKAEQLAIFNLTTNTSGGIN